MGETYGRLRGVPLRYVSASMVDAMLSVACRRVGVTAGTLEREHLEALLQELSHGIRLFCRPEDVARMMIELADLAE